MKVDKIFPHICRLVEFGDKISKGCKTGANISIGEGGVILTNDMRSILVLIEHDEFNEEIAFKSHLYPNPIAPLDIESNGDSVDFSWREKGVEKSTNIQAVGNLYEKGKEVIEKMWNMKNNFMAPVSCFNVIDDDIHVLKVMRTEEGITFQQIKTSADEIITNKIPLKAGGGLLSHTKEDKIKEVETMVSTIEFKTLPLLTDETIINLAIPKDNQAIFGKILMGSVIAKIIVSPMKYKR